MHVRLLCKAIDEYQVKIYFYFLFFSFSYPLTSFAITINESLMIFFREWYVCFFSASDVEDTFIISIWRPPDEQVSIITWEVVEDDRNLFRLVKFQITTVVSSSSRLSWGMAMVPNFPIFIIEPFVSYVAYYSVLEITDISFCRDHLCWIPVMLFINVLNASLEIVDEFFCTILNLRLLWFTIGFICCFFRMLTLTKRRRYSEGSCYWYSFVKLFSRLLSYKISKILLTMILRS